MQCLTCVVNTTCPTGTSLQLGHFPEGNCTAAHADEVLRFSLGFLIAQSCLLGAFIFAYLFRKGSDPKFSFKTLFLFFAWIVVTAVLICEYISILMLNLFFIGSKIIEMIDIIALVGIRIWSNTSNHRNNTGGGVLNGDHFLYIVNTVSATSTVIFGTLTFVLGGGTKVTLYLLFTLFIILQTADVVLSLTYCEATFRIRTLRFIIGAVSLIFPVIGIVIANVDNLYGGLILLALCKMTITISGYMYVLFPPSGSKTRVNPAGLPINGKAKTDDDGDILMDD